MTLWRHCTVCLVMLLLLLLPVLWRRLCIHFVAGLLLVPAASKASVSIKAVPHLKSKGPNICSATTLHFHALEWASNRSIHAGGLQ